MVKNLFNAPFRYLRPILRVMKVYAAPYWKLFALNAVLLAVVSGTVAATAFLVGDLIGKVLLEKDVTFLVWLSFAVVAVFVVKGASVYGSALIARYLNFRISTDVEMATTRKYFSRNVSFFEAKTVSENNQKDSQMRVGAVQTLFIVLNVLPKEALAVISLAGVMIYKKPMLTLFVALLAPIVTIMLQRINRLIKKFYAEEQVLAAAKNTVRKDFLHGFRHAKALSYEGELMRRQRLAIERQLAHTMKLARSQFALQPALEVLAGLMIGLGLLFGGSYLIENSDAAQVGDFASFAVAALLFFDPVRRLGRALVDLHSARIRLNIFLEFMDAEPEEPAPDAADAVSFPTGEIEVSDVSFSYGDSFAIQGLSMRCKAGQLTALVGPSGSGKSTLISLITKLYQPQSGRILVDGVDIRQIPPQLLRRHIAVVSQDAFLFEMSVAENIRAGRLDATDEEVRDAARRAHADTFIKQLSNGYETLVGNRGEKLSGGQRQRIALARAFLRDSKILLLDEATSALDGEVEALIQQSLEELTEGRTTIAVAHRLSTIRRADMIYVMDHGKIIDSGAHEELIARGGYYLSAFSKQQGG